MDQESMKKLARLRIAAAKAGKPFDLARFASDRKFALATVTDIMDTEDENLLVLALEVMNGLGMAGTGRAAAISSLVPSDRPAAAAPATPDAAAAPVPRTPSPSPAADHTADPAAEENKYVGRLR